jgi:hypothetical protein
MKKIAIVLFVVAAALAACGKKAANTTPTPAAGSGAETGSAAPAGSGDAGSAAAPAM